MKPVPGANAVSEVVGPREVPADPGRQVACREAQVQGLRLRQLLAGLGGQVRCTAACCGEDEQGHGQHEDRTGSRSAGGCGFGRSAGHAQPSRTVSVSWCAVRPLVVRVPMAPL